MMKREIGRRGFLAAALAAACAMNAGAAVVEPKSTDEILSNPGMGFVHFYYYSRIWAYGAQQEPGDTLEWMPGTTVVYMRLPWCYLEPQEGVYRWDILDSKTAPWLKAGKKMAFRISCMDHTMVSIPQWAIDAGRLHACRFGRSQGRQAGDCASACRRHRPRLPGRHDLHCRMNHASSFCHCGGRRGKGAICG